MPLIKFSTLVSGVSGKSNGSVFATGGSGAYFRNNTNKKKVQNSLNSVRKSQFVAVTSYWRNLTELQQQAWNDATVNFPKNNRFGDKRNYSGFELFTSVNNIRLQNGLTMVVSPPAPVSVPTLGDVDLVTPGNFLFLPNFMLLNSAIGGNGSPKAFRAINVVSTSFVAGDNTFVIGVDLSATVRNPLYETEPIVLLNGQDNNNNDFILSYEYNNNGLFLLKFYLGKVGSNISFTEIGDGSDLSKPVTIAFSTNGTDISSSQFFVNGEEVSMNYSTVGTLGSSDEFQYLDLFNSPSGDKPAVKIFDFRYSESVFSADDLKLSSLGYYTASQETCFQLNQMQTGGVFVPVIGSNVKTITLEGINQSTINIIPASSNRVPLMSIVSDSVGATDFKVYIYATPCVSFGRLAKVNQQRLIDTLDWSGALDSEVSGAWRGSFGEWSVNGTIQTWVEVVNPVLGISTKPKKKAKGEVRFKAGAEMGSAVN